MNELEKAYIDGLDGIDLEENQEIIIQSKNAELIYGFLHRNKKSSEIDHDRLKEEIINTKNLIYIFLICYLLHYDSFCKVEDIVIESKDLYQIYKFAKYFEKINKEKLFSAMLEYGSEYWIKKFLEEIEFNKDKFKNYLLFI